MVSRKNIKYKQQQEAKQVPHYGVRKLSIGVVSVLLGTVFYMQNGTVHADINPAVSAGNNSVEVVNKNSGISGSTGASSTSIGADSASSVVSAGDATNSIDVRQVSASPVEKTTSQVSHEVAVANEPGSGIPVSQTNAGTSSIPFQNRSVSTSTGNIGNGRWFANLKVNPSVLSVSKVASTGISNNAVNGGFDQSQWGTLDVSKWTGQENNGVYELTGYTGNLEHIIVPNSADFAKAGRNVGQVGISADTTHSWFVKGSPKSIAFSKTDGQMVKAVGSDWTGAFTGAFDRSGEHTPLESVLTLFDGSNLDILNITNMLDMFAFNQISDLTSLANWKTDNVTDMRGMFGNNQISDLAPLANWKTNNVTDMGAMFMIDQISDLTPIANWKTNNVTNMGYMFMSNQITYADFTKWDFGKVNSLDYFIYQWTPAIIIAKNVDQALLSNSQAISTQQNQLHFGSDTVDIPTVYVASDEADARQKILADIKTKVSEYQANHTDKMLMPTVPLDQLTKLVDLANAKFTGVNRTLPELDTNDAFALDPVNGLHEHKNVNDNGGYDTDFWGTLDVSKFTTVKNGDNLEITGYTGDGAKVIIPNIADFELNNLDQGAKQVTISSNVMHDLAKTATRIGLSKTNNQKVVAGDANWQDAFGGQTNEPNTDSNANGGMWVYNPALTVMDLHNLDTTNITDMSAMFNGGRNLNVVGDLSNWDTSNVTDMSYMFQSASKLKDLGNLGGWKTGKVTDMSRMFNGDESLTNIGVLSNWDTHNVTDMSYMFQSDSKLENLGNLDHWKTGNVMDMSFMFNNMPALTNVGDLSHWDTYNVESMSYMFNNDRSLASLGVLSNWDTHNVMDMSFMFQLASKLKDLGNLDHWQTGKVTDMSRMFNGDESLTNIGDLSNWDTSNVTNMSYMFQSDGKLKNLGNLGSWHTGNVTDMSFMFNNMPALTNVGDLSKWDTHNVENMSFMFNNDGSLVSLGDLSKWDTSNVTNMSFMFQLAGKLKNLGNLGGWKTGKVTDMSRMFNYAESLTNIGDLSKWDTHNVTNMSYMFQFDSKLGNLGNLGRWQTGKVTDMSWMFNSASKLTNIGDLSKWDTSHVTNMSCMFVSTEALHHLNISNWNLTKLVNKDSMKYMFANDTDLTIIANDLALPVWYQNEINDSDYFWNNHMAVITNVPELIRSTGDIDNLKIDKQDASRSIFYDSKGSSDAIQVLKDANQAYIKQYQNEHPGYTLNLAANVDQTDPIALANANFISAPREVQFTIAYYDLTGKLVDSTTSTHKVGDNVSILLAAPANYVLGSGQSSNDRLMHWGLNEADFLVEPKVTMSTETKTVSRTIMVQAPDGQTNNVVQTVTFVRNGYLNQVTKQTTYSSWSFGGQYQFSGYLPKPVDGYTADVASGVIVTPDSSDTMLSLTYHKQAAVYSVDYQLANGTVVKNVSVTPGSDGLIHLTAPQGYRLLTTVTDVQVGPSSQKLAVLVAPAEQTYTAHDDLPSGVTKPLIKTVTRTVKITLSNGHVRTIKQSVKFERTATVKADGTVVYSNWQALGRAQFNKVFVPKRRGYHLVITDASGKALTNVEKVNNVTAETNDAVVSVQYVKD